MRAVVCEANIPVVAAETRGGFGAFGVGDLAFFLGFGRDGPLKTPDCAEHNDHLFIFARTWQKSRNTS
jgi:hypothetical protein